MLGLQNPLKQINTIDFGTGSFIKMEMFSGWNFVAMMGVCLLLVSPTRIFAFLDSTPTGTSHKVETLDGLRGFLALGVVAHHITEMITSSKTGIWQTSPFFVTLGQLGTSTFFMITGYLFWSKLLSKKGKLDWVGLYIGRLFRISPLYIFMLAWALFLIYINTDGVLHQPATEVALQAAKWLGFGFFGFGEVNGQSPSVLTFGVTWTLRYEWIFYFSLPVLAVFAATRRHLLLLALALLVATQLPNAIPVVDHFHIGYFLCGMITASIHKKFPRITINGPFWSVIAATAIIYLLNNFTGVYSWTAVLLLGPVFFMIASGASLFGLLKSTAAKRLGNISYSIYLLQGLVLVTAFSGGFLGQFSTQGNWQLWTTLLLAVLALVLTSAATFVLIERPGITLGKKVHTLYLIAKDALRGSPQPS